VQLAGEQRAVRPVRCQKAMHRYVHTYISARTEHEGESSSPTLGGGEKTKKTATRSPRGNLDRRRRRRRWGKKKGAALGCL